MRLFLMSLTLLASLPIAAAQAGDAIGFREMTLADKTGSRPLPVALWYPSDDDGARETVAENPAFLGVEVMKEAKVAPGPLPLVVLSHGYGGSWRNLSWLAGELARQGYVVAAPDHPGTTTFDRNKVEAAKLWERPRDVSRVIDAVSAEQEIDLRRIAAIGHSLGGWTVAELAGGRFDAARVTADCQAQFGPVACKLFGELGIGANDETTAKLGSDLSDPRIGAVVTLDLGPARGFTPESLDAVRIPVLIVAASTDITPDAVTKADIAATNKDSLYLAEHLPKATTSYRAIPDALHFSFLQICKPGAAQLIEEEAPGEGIVCSDGGTRGRAAIHRETADEIITFLARSLPPG